MKVLIVGATFNSNFGDLLFSHLLYDKCKEVGFERVPFWQWPEYVLCDFVRNELDYHEEISILHAFRYDALILQSGGMMGDKIHTKNGVKLRFIRYFVPTLLFTILRKPIYILGCGGGPLYSRSLRKMAKFIWNRARRITVRDVETRDYFQSIGVTRGIEVTSDTAQVITPQLLPPFDRSAELDSYLKGRKLLLFVAHFPKKGDAQESIIFPAIREFLQTHPDYAIVVTTDKAETVDQTREFLNDKKDYLFCSYCDCFQLASLLNYANVIFNWQIKRHGCNRPEGTLVLHYLTSDKQLSSFVLSQNDLHLQIKEKGVITNIVKYYLSNIDQAFENLTFVVTEEEYNLLQVAKNSPVMQINKIHPTIFRFLNASILAIRNFRASLSRYER